MRVPVLLQPRVNQPPPGDPMPGATDADASLPAMPDPTAPVADPGTSPAPAPVTGVTQEVCETASRDALISAGGYAFGASLVGIVVFLVMRKKLWSSAFGRYLTAIGVACVLGATLAGWDPVASDNLALCLNSPELKQYIFLGGQLFARAIVLGLLPSFVVTTTGCLIANRT